MNSFVGSASPSGHTFVGSQGANVFVPASHSKFAQAKSLFRDTQTAFRDSKPNATALLAQLTALVASAPRVNKTKAAKAAQTKRPEAILKGALKKLNQPNPSAPPIGTVDQDGYVEVGCGMKFH